MKFLSAWPALAYDQYSDLIESAFRTFILLLHTTSVVPVRDPYAPPSCDYHYMTQNVDHFAAHNGTFQQRYTIFTEFFIPGGPIMFFHGEESVSLDCANDTVMYYFAKELGGLAVSLEHRYFGESLPLGHNVLGDTEHMKYLTLDNIIEDAAEFIDQIRFNVTGAKTSKAIVASGSYGGFLAAVFRLNRPDTFFGSLAAAAPVKGFGHNSDHKHNWWTYNTRTWLQKSAEASKKLKNAFDILRTRIETKDNIESLKEELGLCQRPTAEDATTLPLLLVALPRLWFFVTEFNYNFANPGRAPVANSFETAVNITLEENDPIQVLNRTFWMWYGVPGMTHLECLDPLAFCTPTVPLIEQIPFSYITCLFMPLFSAGNIPEGTLWPAYTPLSGTIDQHCQETWGITPMEEEEIFSRYHISAEEIENSQRIIFSQGEYDPTTSVSVDFLKSSLDPHASRVLWVSNMAHREDLFAPHLLDKQEVTRARQVELEIFRKWLENSESG